MSDTNTLSVGPKGRVVIPVEIRRTPPTLGRDTVEVLRGAGYSEADISALEQKGVTAPAPLSEE